MLILLQSLRGFILNSKVLKFSLYHNWCNKISLNHSKLLFINKNKMLQTEELLAPLRSDVQIQGDIVRRLKTENASEIEIKKAVAVLKLKKRALEVKELELSSKYEMFDKTKLEDLLKQRFFYDQSFSIYGGVQGLYDYGPMGCAIKANILAAWRQFFILEEQLLEVDCTVITPEPVLKASGHVDRFTDFMVKDTINGECFRADHLIKATLEGRSSAKATTKTMRDEIQRVLSQLDNYSESELAAIITQYNIKSPITDNPLTEPMKFNLMFGTSIGPTGQLQGFLRPETAQGIFVNFQRLLQFNQSRLPFGAAQIGPAFRNEISPRSGLIRVREFTMAEIEYFVDPSNKCHPKFARHAGLMLRLLTASDQLDGKPARETELQKALSEGIIANETLAYFMARIYLFVVMVGADPARLRFRQHMSNEMAHYACECWDLECRTSYGWVECVGCADRSCYDLEQHAKATGSRLVAEKLLPQPVVVRSISCQPDKGILGRVFRGSAKAIINKLAQLRGPDLDSFRENVTNKGEAVLAVDDEAYTISVDMVRFSEQDVTMHVEEIIPTVIEPSFGIGRIMYAIFEHNFKIRENDEQRTYLALPTVIAPYKCSVLPLSSNPEFVPFVRDLSEALTRFGISHKVDESTGSIGRRYARTDQIAIPYAITVDFDTVNRQPASATLRERDSMSQIRVTIEDLPSLVAELANGIITWEAALDKYPLFEQQDTGK